MLNTRPEPGEELGDRSTCKRLEREQMSLRKDRNVNTQMDVNQLRHSEGTRMGHAMWNTKAYVVAEWCRIATAKALRVPYAYELRELPERDCLRVGDRRVQVIPAWSRDEVVYCQQFDFVGDLAVFTEHRRGRSFALQGWMSREDFAGTYVPDDLGTFAIPRCDLHDVSDLITKTFAETQ